MMNRREEKSSVQMSERLRTVAGMVTPGNRLADIGTDHGFVPIYLVENGIVPSALAMDVNEGPLGRAEEHIREHGLMDQIETRLSDGLEKLGRDEADTVLIAGMGGGLIERILGSDPTESGPACAVPDGVRELVLGPQSEIAHLRRYLALHGWKIADEKMVLEDGKYYQLIKAEKCPEPYGLPDIEAEFGPVLLRERDPVLRKFLEYRQGILSGVAAALKTASGPRAEQRRGEIGAELSEIREALALF